MGADWHTRTKKDKMDIVNKETRSRMMSSVRAKNTKLELEIRRRLFGMGFRFRLHDKDLPGKPDIVLAKYSSVIFIHGCFWHQHGCKFSKLPETRHEWWKTKLVNNRGRDILSVQKLKELGWRIMIVWECSFRRPGIIQSKVLDKITNRAASFLRSRDRYLEIPKEP